MYGLTIIKECFREISFTNFSVYKGVLLAALVLLNACGGGYSESQSDDLPPVANASAIGLGNSTSTTGNYYSARSNSQVVLTGKDSSSDYAPILTFDWAQIDGDIVVDLVERTSNAVAFDTPNVSTLTTLGFNLTVTDANGNTDSSTVYIDINPGDDADRFLADPRIAGDSLTILAALQGGEDTGDSDLLFSLDVISTAHWRNRLGEMDQMVVSTQTVNSLFPANFTPSEGYNALAESMNPVFSIDLKRFDADDVNQHFEDSNRDRRIEVYELPNAYMDIQFSISSPPGVEFELFALDKDSLGVDIASRTMINSAEVDDAATPPANGSLLQTWTGYTSVNFLTTLIRHELDLENTITANNYYSLIDSAGESTTLTAWKMQAGFIDEYGEPVEDSEIAHALYVNNFDLGFGRDMYLRKADNGNVYSYVMNYPTIEAGMQKRGDFAVVAMEYSENPDPNGANAKIVKFYAFAPDKRTGEFVRSPSMNFDGGGERFIPGVCMVCHQSYQGSRDYTDVSHADLEATFMPWDVDSFLFSHADNPEFIEPTLDTNKFSATELAQYSRESQDAEIKKLNLGALATYKDDPVRNEAPIQLIHSWYGDPEVNLPVDELPADSTFDGSLIPPGWVGHEELYTKVVARNCRLCHTQLARKDRNFDSYDEFIGLKDKIIDYVYEEGRMPAVRLTMDRFWVSFNGEQSAAELLRTHLLALDEAVPEFPGLPIPLFDFSSSNPTIDDLVTLNAASSSFSRSYTWSMTPAEGSTVDLGSSTGVNSSFAPDVPGGTYSVTLTTENEKGEVESITESVTLANRVPVAECLTASTSGITNEGLLENIPVVSNIAGLGDGGVLIDSVFSGSFGNIAIDNGSQTLSYQLDNPFIRGLDTVEYQLVDFDGSLSTTSGDCITTPASGYGHITIDTSLVGLVPTNVTAATDAVNNTSEVTISWDPPTEVIAESYTLWRDGVELLLDATEQTTRNYTDTPLAHGTAYTYTVRTVITESESEDSDPSVASTLSLVPGGLAGSSVDTNQIDLSWNSPVGNETSFNVYRDDGAGYVLLGSSGASLSYSDMTVGAGTAYDYRVTAFDSTGQESGASNIISNTSKPEPPGSLAATAISTNQIDLTWPSVTDATSYKVYRKLTSDISFPGSPLVTPATNSFSDTSASAGFSYDYLVGATVGGEDSITFATDTESSFPVAPSNFAATETGSTTSQINLSWTAPIGDIDSYNIYRTGTVGAIVNVTSTSYSDSGRNSGTLYNYTVKAVAGGHESILGDTDSGATKPAKPAGSGKPTATVVNADRITVGGYAISCSDTPSYSIKPSGISATTSGDASTNINGLTGNTGYTFTVTATCNNVPSSTSNASNSKTTEVSYADNIQTSVVNSVGCQGCHSPNTVAVTKARITSNPYSSCITNDKDLSDCNAAMAGVTLTDSQLQLILDWYSDGYEN